MFYSFILSGSLSWQFSSKTNLYRVFILQKKCLRIITFSFYKDHSNSLLKDLKLLKLHDILESEVIKSFCKFSRNELPKSACTQFNLVHEVHTHNTRNNLLIYIQECLPLNMAITSGAVKVLLYGINSLNIFFLP